MDYSLITDALQIAGIITGVAVLGFSSGVLLMASRGVRILLAVISVRNAIRSVRNSSRDR